MLIIFCVCSGCIQAVVGQRVKVPWSWRDHMPSCRRRVSVGITHFIFHSNNKTCSLSVGEKFSTLNGSSTNDCAYGFA